MGHVLEARSLYKRCYSKRFAGSGSEVIYSQTNMRICMVTLTLPEFLCYVATDVLLLLPMNQTLK